MFSQNQNLHYFRMKVSTGNEYFWPCVAYSLFRAGKLSLIDLGKKELRETLEARLKDGPEVSLYVGHKANQWIPTLRGNDVLAENLLSPGAGVEHFYNYDFYSFAYANANKEKCRFLIYTEKYLVICQPTGKWEQEDEDNIMAYREFLSKEKSRDLKLLTLKKTKKGKEGKKPIEWSLSHCFKYALFQVKI